MAKFNPKKKVEKLTDIEEGLRSLYEPIKDDDDKITGYKLKDEISKAISGDDLKLKLKEANKKIKELNEKNPEQDPDEDEEEEEDLEEEKLAKQRKFKKETKEDLESNDKLRVNNKRLQQIQEDLNKQKEENNKLLSNLVYQQKKSFLISGLAEKGGNKTLLMNHLVEKIGEEKQPDGQMKFFVKDKDGDARFEGSQEFTLGDLLDEMKSKDEFKAAFSDEKKEGVGTDKFDKTNKTKLDPSVKIDQLTTKQEFEFIEKYGHDAYKEATNRMIEEKSSKIYDSHKKENHNLLDKI